ncbi:hypothetical protein PPERSA_00405 [Pseudocohnilembus persalinus]|uniref:Uncharacterized protein n=1 Tax=Pseudocohnilembus persalinus TaxID=266149 RepID=A0A0V0QYX1_PSEPJ|nr:hypothetical protein PPERSA_00405 [Pseudocohnilembus persalinus]|eukprot:KRX07248.1 hypothetical protein PPERSA_00405 [Pseudocohnilembus persalinus]
MAMEEANLFHEKCKGIKVQQGIINNKKMRQNQKSINNIKQSIFIFNHENMSNLDQQKQNFEENLINNDPVRIYQLLKNVLYNIIEMNDIKAFKNGCLIQLLTGNINYEKMIQSITIFCQSSQKYYSEIEQQKKNQMVQNTQETKCDMNYSRSGSQQAKSQLKQEQIILSNNKEKFQQQMDIVNLLLQSLGPKDQKIDVSEYLFHNSQVQFELIFNVNFEKQSLLKKNMYKGYNTAGTVVPANQKCFKLISQLQEKNQE